MALTKNALLSSRTQQKRKSSSSLPKSNNFLPKINSNAIKSLSAEEEAEHRSKNLCFYCHGKFSKDHKCPQRQKMQLHFIEIQEITKDEISTEDLEKNDNTEEETPLISLYAIEGVEGASSMRVVGYCGKRQLQILIDNGSTHDFLNVELARKLGWQPNGTYESWVEVTSRRKLKLHEVWVNFKWHMRGLDFAFDLKISELHSYDMVQGLH